MREAGGDYRKTRNLGVVRLTLMYCRKHPSSNKKYSLDQLSCFVIQGAFTTAELRARNERIISAYIYIPMYVSTR